MQCFPGRLQYIPGIPPGLTESNKKRRVFSRTPEATIAAGCWSAGTEFTEFTCTQVQILTQEADLQVHPDPQQPPSSQQENSRIRPADAPTVDSTRRGTRISIRPAEAPHIYSTHRGTRIRPAEAHRKHVAQRQPLITIAQSISGVENAQSMAEPAREGLLNSCRTLQVNPPPLPNLLLI